jgi:phosphatidylethanolamine/phosphatidyl-N-methylethanolamine N-methyltransferase
MAEAIDPSIGPVVEFGPGTGRISHALLERGIAPSDLTLIEMNPAFSQHLQQKFPEVGVLNIAAQDITAHYPTKAAAVVSGLPLLSMKDDLQQAILKSAFDVLAPGGIYVQFTYGLRPPVKPAIAASLGLTWRKLGRVWENLPPAQIYVYTRLTH